MQAPGYFVPWLLQTTERGGGRPVTKTINGKAYTFIPQFFSWDTTGSRPAQKGQIRLDSKNNRELGDWQINDRLKTDQALINVLDSAATPSGLDSHWRYADLLALRWDGAGAPGLQYSEPVPELTQIMNKQISFNDLPMKPGRYFPKTQVPADLSSFYALMLAYGNAGRRDPDFRKKRTEPKTAIDLSGATVNTLDGPQKVFKQNPAPPYFTPQVLNEKLNAAAQFQAEYIASINRITHDGPRDYRDPASGKIVDMSHAWLRAEFFGAGREVVEAAGLGGPGDYPEGWLHSDTHFRPWFNVDGCYPEIGFGAAMIKRGTWALVAVPFHRQDCSKSAAPSQPAAVSSTTPDSFPLRAGATIVQGRKYRSASGKHYLVFQPDGNIVVYNAANQFAWDLRKFLPKLWEVKSVALQADGNLVVRGPNGAYIWSALTRDPDASASLTLTPEGVLQLVSGKSGATLWASDKGLTPVPPPVAQTRPVVLEVGKQYAVLNPDNTFRYHVFVGATGDATVPRYEFDYCPANTMTANGPLRYSDHRSAVKWLRVEDALARGLKTTGEPCDVNKAPFGR